MKPVLGERGDAVEVRLLPEVAAMSLDGAESDLEDSGDVLRRLSKCTFLVRARRALGRRLYNERPPSARFAAVPGHSGRGHPEAPARAARHSSGNEALWYPPSTPRNARQSSPVANVLGTNDAVTNDAVLVDFTHARLSRRE